MCLRNASIILFKNEDQKWPCNPVSGNIIMIHKTKFWWRYCFTSVCSVCLFVCLSVCLSVYLLAGFRKNYWTKLDQILTEYCPKYRIEPINFSEVKVKYQGHRGVKRFWDENSEKWSDFHDFF